MKRKIWTFISLFTMVLLTGCVSLNSVSLTQLPESREHLVTASASDMVFLGLTTQNDFVDEAVENLKAKCQGGKLTGVLTKHQTTAYLVVFKREVIASGYCSILEG